TNPTGANGLDWSPLNRSSLKAGTNLSPVLDTRMTSLSMAAAQTTSANNAYFIFVRGDRLLINTNPLLSNITTLSSKGRLQTGSQVFNAGSTAASFTLIGNPYASPLDLAKMERNNISNQFWVWDPYLNTDQGGYVVIEVAFGSSTYITAPPSNLTKILQSGQAFFVKTSTNAPASITFTEIAKSATSIQVPAFRPLGQPPSFRVNLFHINENDSTVLLDGVLAQFNNDFSLGVDIEDAEKAGNVKEMLALQRYSKKLTIEKRPVLRAHDTLFFELTKTIQCGYRFGFEPSNLDPALTAFLEDSYTGIKTPMSITESSVYDFDINEDAGSAAANRFRIVFKQSAALPVTFKSVKAFRKDADIVVEWTVENEINITRYEVERSSDGLSFVKVNSTVATGADRTSTVYSWLDPNPLTGNNFYRVSSISPDGGFAYYKVVLVKMGNSISGISIYPNPVTDGNIGAEFKNMPDGEYNIRLHNNLGQTVFNKMISHISGNSMEIIRPGYELVSGIYQMEVMAPDKYITRVKLIVK
ncbi:MAG: T9SS type A sorting domain-containing protein, partial [Ferruginibacter sp.]